jgi:hypothetical protein
MKFRNGKKIKGYIKRSVRETGEKVKGKIKERQAERKHYKEMYKAEYNRIKQKAKTERTIKEARQKAYAKYSRPRESFLKKVGKFREKFAVSEQPRGRARTYRQEPFNILGSGGSMPIMNTPILPRGRKKAMRII